jgi:glyoxylase-like metal-dependent hydrolase (beta-lactamase superfamily II)
MGRRVEDVTALVLTHNHTDHLGVAGRLRDRSGARVLVHEVDAGIVRGDEKPKPIPGFIGSVPHRSFLGYLRHVVRNGGAKRPEVVAEAETFGDGDVLDVPGRPRVIYTPGHSPGHSSFLLEERGVLFSGDALVTLNLRTGARGPTLLPINQDHVQAARSLERFEGVEATSMLPGHGDPWTGGVGEARRQARARLPS